MHLLSKELDYTAFYLIKSFIVYGGSGLSGTCTSIKKIKATRLACVIHFLPDCLFYDYCQLCSPNCTGFTLSRFYINSNVLSINKQLYLPWDIFDRDLLEV